MRYADEKNYRQKNKRSNTNASSNADWRGRFISLSPTKEDKEAILSLIKSENFDEVGLIAKIVEAGYKFSVKWHVANNAYQATLTGLENCDFNEDMVLAAYHADIHIAIGILLWGAIVKHPTSEPWQRTGLGFDVDW